jgi:hypothetical protein
MKLAAIRHAAKRDGSIRGNSSVRGARSDSFSHRRNPALQEALRSLPFSSALFVLPVCCSFLLPLLLPLPFFMRGRRHLHHLSLLNIEFARDNTCLGIVKAVCADNACGRLFLSRICHTLG